MSKPRFEDIEVEVSPNGPSGNAFAVMGNVSRALKRAGHGDKVEEYMNEAMSGDYDNLLRVTEEWVTVV